jgi:hypothetical protein
MQELPRDSSAPRFNPATQDIKTTLLPAETQPLQLDKEVTCFVKRITSSFSWAKYHSMMASDSLVQGHK